MGSYINTLDIIVQKRCDDLAEAVASPGLNTFLNPYTYLQHASDNRWLTHFDRLFVDGILLCKLLAWGSVCRIERRSFDMTSLAAPVLSHAAERGLTVFIIGSPSPMNRKAVAVIGHSFPDLKIVGYRHGFFADDGELQAVSREVTTLGPDLVLAGMGAPLQERFLVQLRRHGWGGFGFTCGGFLHQVSAGLDYYPKLVDRLELRWLYRAAREPIVFNRLLRQYPRFLGRFLADWAELKRR